MLVLTLSFKILPYHPFLEEHLTLKHVFVVVGENNSIMLVDEEPTPAGLPHEKIVNFGSVIGIDAVSVCPLEAH